MWVYILTGLPILLYILRRIWLSRQTNSSNTNNNTNNDYWPSRGVPLVLASDIPGAYQAIAGQRPLHEVDTAYYNQYPDAPFVGIMEAGTPLLYIRDPEVVKKMTVKDFDHFVNRRTFHFGGELSDYFLANTLGNRWKSLRAAMTPTFTSGKMRRMFEHFEKSATDFASFVERQKEKVNDGDGRIVDTREVFGRYTMDVIGSTAFGIDSQCLTDDNSPFYKQGNLLMKIDWFRGFKLSCIITVPRLANLLGFDLLPAKPAKFFTTILKRALVDRRRESSAKNSGSKNIPLDFIQLMIEAQKAGNQSHNDKEKEDEDEMEDYERDAKIHSSKKVEIPDLFIVANSFNFITAGFDATEAILSVAAYHLAVLPDVQDRLREEVDLITSEYDGKVTYDGVVKMAYVDMFVSECFRLYPPATRFERKVNKEYTIPASGSYPEVILPVGSLVVFPMLAFHKDPKYFPNPETFDPEHFSRENKAKRHPYVYMPWGLGPRSCIATRFVLTQVKAAVAHLVLKYEVQTCRDTYIPFKLQELQGQHRPAAGLKVALVKRS